MALLASLLVCAAATATSALPAGTAAATPPPAPNYHGCVTELARSFAYCTTSLTHEERARSLVHELTLVEKVGLIAPDPGLGNTCFAHIHAIPRVGLPQYGWLVEARPEQNSRLAMGLTY